MQKPLAIFSGVLAAVSILAGAIQADPRDGDRRDGDRRGGLPPGYGGGGARPPAVGGFHYPQAGGYPEAFHAQRPPPNQPPPPNMPYGYAPPRRPNSLGADWREQQEEARSGVRQGQMAPLGSVIAGIGHRAAGRPLDAGIEYQDGRAVYRVRWLMNNGRRVDYLVDAASGQIIGEH